MSTIRIAFIVEATAGGVARHVIDLVTHLDRSLLQCFLYLSFERPESERKSFLELAERGITIREIPMNHLPNPVAVRQIGEWLRQDSIDIVHAHSAKAGYIGRKAAFKLGIPVIYTPHAFPFQRATDWLRPIYRVVERRMAAKTDRIICVSNGEAEEALAAGLPQEKLVIIPNGIDEKRWSLPSSEERKLARAKWGFAEDNIVIGALAHLVPQKGIDLLVTAFMELTPDFPELHLAIWGDGPLRKLFVSTAQGKKNISFLGGTNEPRWAYAAMDIYCAPSRWEGGPYAVLEAMASGLPILASEVPGNVDYLEDGKSGLLTNAESGSIEIGLRKLLINNDFRESLGRAAYHRVISEFTIEKMVNSTIALYHTIKR